MKQKQTDKYKEQTCGCQGGEEWESEGSEVWDQQMQTIKYGMDKQQGPTV